MGYRHLASHMVSGDYAATIAKIWCNSSSTSCAHPLFEMEIVHRTTEVQSLAKRTRLWARPLCLLLFGQPNTAVPRE